MASGASLWLFRDLFEMKIQFIQIYLASTIIPRVLARKQITECLKMFSLFRLTAWGFFSLRKISWGTQVHTSLEYGYLAHLPFLITFKFSFVYLGKWWLCYRVLSWVLVLLQFHKEQPTSSTEPHFKMHFPANCRRRIWALSSSPSLGRETSAIYLHFSPDWDDKGISGKLMQPKPKWLAFVVGKEHLCQSHISFPSSLLAEGTLILAQFIATPKENPKQKTFPCGWLCPCD